MATTLLVRTDRGEEQLDLDEFEIRVARGQIAPQCPVQFAPVTGKAWVPAGSLEIFRQRYSRRELRFSSSFRLGGVPWATLSICLLNVLWYVWMQLWPVGTTDDTLIAFGAKAGPLLLDLGQFWRLITANFVHRGLLHIGMNLFVLFNFAGAVETAFGSWEMALILFASAFGTTALSAVISSPTSASAGASGVAYGALGAAVVFGLKYRPLLPERYRRVLGGAVVPTVLVFFYIGLTSTGVDNWGHVGGFLAGSMATAVLKPRLLAAPDRARPRWRLLMLAGGILGTVLLGPLTRPVLPRMATRLDDELGLAVKLPAEWELGASSLGGRTYLNGLTGYASARLTISGEVAESPDLTQVLDDVTKGGLWEPEADEKLQVRELGSLEKVALAGGRLTGLSRRAVFTRGGLAYDFRALALQRGGLVYVLEAVSSRAEPAYRALLDRAIANLVLEEPLFLRQARGQRLFLPGASETKSELRKALAVAGETPPSGVERAQ